MTIIDKLNQLLQKAINYTQEGLRQEGFNVDFQSSNNPNMPQYDQYGNYQGTQAYPPHPNLDPNMYPQQPNIPQQPQNSNWCQQMPQQQSQPINIEINADKSQNNQTFINIDSNKHQ